MAKLTIDLNHFKKKDYISRSKGKPSLFVILPEWQWYDWRKDINTIKELKFCLVNDWKFYRILYKRQLRIFTMEMYGFARSHTIFQCLWEFCHILEAYVFYSEVFFFCFFFWMPFWLVRTTTLTVLETTNYVYPCMSDTNNWCKKHPVYSQIFTAEVWLSEQI